MKSEPATIVVGRHEANVLVLRHFASQFVGIVCAARDSVVDIDAEDCCVGFTQLPKITKSIEPFGLQWV